MYRQLLIYQWFKNNEKRTSPYVTIVVSTKTSNHMEGFPMTIIQQPTLFDIDILEFAIFRRWILL